MKRLLEALAKIPEPDALAIGVYGYHRLGHGLEWGYWVNKPNESMAKALNTYPIVTNAQDFMACVANSSSINLWALYLEKPKDIQVQLWTDRYNGWSYSEIFAI